MNDTYSKKREYLVNSIKKKAESYKNELGSLYDQLSQMPVDLSIEELEELNDLSLFTDYLDYTKALQNRKLSDNLKSKCDKHINFSMIVTHDGEAVFDTSIIEGDRESAKEDAWFREHNAGGVLVFEDYDDENDLVDDLIDSTDEMKSFLSQLNDELEEDEIEFEHEESAESDSKLSAEDKLLSDILKEMEGKEPVISPKSFNDLNDFLESLNSGMTVVDIEDASKSSYDFFSDFSDDADDDFDLELDLMSETYSSKSSDEIFNEEYETDIEAKLEDPDFKEDYKNKLNDKWGMFKLNSPSITFEDLDSYDSSYLCLFINRGLIELPDDTSLIPDEIVDMLILGGVLNERPVKKEVVEEVKEEIIEDKSDIIEKEFNIHSTKRIFKSEHASNVVDKAGLLGDKLLSFGTSKLKKSNEEILSSAESDEVFNGDVIEELGDNNLDENKSNEETSVVDEYVSVKDEPLKKDFNKFFGGFFDTVDVFELEDD